MDKEVFILGYCDRSHITRKFFDTWFTALPCACDYDECDGWAAIHKGGEEAHMMFYAPTKLIDGETNV